MGLLKRLKISRSLSSGGRKRSIFSLVPVSEVTEASLQVWRNLPPTIRHDPSMISFQQENERYRGEYCGFDSFLIEVESILLKPPKIQLKHLIKTQGITCQKQFHFKHLSTITNTQIPIF